jgi:hypothetical protein
VTFRTSLVLLLGVASCTTAQQSSQAEWAPVAAPDLGDVVAKVGGVPIFAKQLLAEAKRGGTTPRIALAHLIDEYLAAESAHRYGRAVAPVDDADVKSALVQRYVERELEAELDPSAIPTSTLRTVYEHVHDRFVHPRLVDVGILVVFTGALMKGEPRKMRAETASELASFLAQHPARSLDEFSAVAKDSKWATRNVVYRRMLQGTDQPLSKAIGSEIQKLHAPGQTTPLTSDDTGFYIARYIDERPPENVSFEQARGTIVAEYFEHWRQEQFLNLTGKMLRQHTIAEYFDRITPDEQGR